MKRFILLISLVLPIMAVAQIPAIEKLGEEASKHKDVEYESVGSFMLGMASTFANKEQRATYKMLENIEMIVCQNRSYETTLDSRIKAIINEIGAKFLVSAMRDNERNDLYAIQHDDIIKELIILTYGNDGGMAVVAMSGEIPINRLGEIATLSKPE